MISTRPLRHAAVSIALVAAACVAVTRPATAHEPIFGAGRYKHNGTTADNVDVGDALIVDAAVGFRPVRTPYLAPDTVVMVELNYHARGRGRRGGALIPDTGREVLFLSAGVWLTYRNHAFKPGIQVPIFSDVNGSQARPAWRAVFSYAVHTGSLFGR